MEIPSPKYNFSAKVYILTGENKYVCEAVIRAAAYKIGDNKGWLYKFTERWDTITEEDIIGIVGDVEADNKALRLKVPPRIKALKEHIEVAHKNIKEKQEETDHWVRQLESWSFELKELEANQDASNESDQKVT